MFDEGIDVRGGEETTSVIFEVCGCPSVIKTSDRVPFCPMECIEKLREIVKWGFGKGDATSVANLFAAGIVSWPLDNKGPE